MSTLRLRELQSELQVLAGAQEGAVSDLLAATLSALTAVASDGFPGRISVRNEARRLKLVLEREAPAFSSIVDRST